MPAGYPHTFIIVADNVAWPRRTGRYSSSTLTVTVPVGTSRAVMPEMWGIENNLSIANMDFDDFADAVDGNGVHRGF